MSFPRALLDGLSIPRHPSLQFRWHGDGQRVAALPAPVRGRPMRLVLRQPVQLVCQTPRQHVVFVVHRLHPQGLRGTVPVRRPGGRILLGRRVPFQEGEVGLVATL